MLQDWLVGLFLGLDTWWHKAADVLDELGQTGTYFSHLCFHSSSLFPSKFCFRELRRPYQLVANGSPLVIVFGGHLQDHVFSLILGHYLEVERVWDSENLPVVVKGSNHEGG